MRFDKHLLTEIKHELDWAAEEVSRTENEVMKLEVDFNKSMESVKGDIAEIERLSKEKENLQERVGLSEAYALQRRAAQRFYMVSHVYDIASSHKSSEQVREELGCFLFRAIDGGPENADQRDKLLEISEALMAYFADGHSDEADEAIREAWQNIEESLRKLGRRI